MPDSFYLDTDNGSHECRIIASLYSNKRKKHYLVYEYVNGPQEDIYVSSYNPDDTEDDCLMDITDENEMMEIEKLLNEYMEE